MSDAAVEFDDFTRSRSRNPFRTGWLLLGDWDLAEDLTQTALLRGRPPWHNALTKLRAARCLRGLLSEEEAIG